MEDLKDSLFDNENAFGYDGDGFGSGLRGEAGPTWPWRDTNPINEGTSTAIDKRSSWWKDAAPRPEAGGSGNDQFWDVEIDDMMEWTDDFDVQSSI